MAAYSENPLHYVDKLPEFINVDIGEINVKRDLYVRNTATSALYNLETALRFVEDDKLKIRAPRSYTSSGRPTQASLKNLGQRLQEGDWYEEEIVLEGIGHIQAFAWPVLLQGGGLATVEGNALKLNPKGKAALTENLPHTIKDIWAQWRTTELLDEFSRVDAIKGQKTSGGRVLFPAHTRRPVLYEGLLLCTPGKWLKVEALIGVMHAADLEFEVAKDAFRLYVGNSQRGHLDDYGDQSIINTRYVLAFLFEYAATLGLIDVAYIHPQGALSDYHSLWGWENIGSGFLSRYDGLKFIRINPLGAYAMEMTARYEPEIADNGCALTALPNHDVLDDVKNHSKSLIYSGRWHLIACEDARLQKRLISEKKISNTCLPVGEKHLVLIPGKEKKFMAALAHLGYDVPHLKEQI